MVLILCGGSDRGGGGGCGGGCGGGGGGIRGAAMSHSSVRRISKPRMMIVAVASSSSIFSLGFALSLLAFVASAHIITGKFVFLFYSFIFSYRFQFSFTICLVAEKRLESERKEIVGNKEV